MAKKNNKKGKKNNKSKDINNRYRYLVRVSLKQYLDGCYNYLKNNKFFVEETVSNVIEHIKELTIKNINEGVLGKYTIDKLNIIKIYDYISETLVLYLVYKKSIDECINHIKNKMIDIIGDDAVLYLYITDYSCLKYLNSDYSKVLKDEKYAIPQCINTMILYMATYSMKLENHMIDSIVEEDGKLIYKYSKDIILKENIIEYLISKVTTDDISEKELSFLDLIKIQRVSAFNKFLPTLSDDERKFLKTTGYLYNINKYNKALMPFRRDADNWLMGDKTIGNFISDRKYAIPSKGICFTFKDNFYISKIEMKENINNIIFNIHIKNNDNIYVTKLKEEEKCNEREIVIPRMISKEGLFSVEQDDWYNDVGCIVSNEPFAEDLIYLLFCCTYIAYVNPNFNTNIVTLSNIKDTESSGFAKESYYRIGHIRKLPKGYNMSEDAKKRSIEEGFV